MKPGARRATSALLAAVLAALTIPAAVQLAPAVDWHTPEPQPVLVTPAAQLPPTSLSRMSLLGDLDRSAPVPDSAALAQVLGPALALDDGTVSAAVLDAATGTVLYGTDADTGRTPASSLKIFTGAAALLTLGADTTLTTQVVRGAEPNSVVLVGGGDVLLGAGASDPAATVGRAGLASLAEDTARALAAEGVRGPVTVSVDDSFFVGPAISSGWSPADVAAGEIGPIHALAQYSGFAAADPALGRVADPALAAAETFRTALAAAAARPEIAVNGAPQVAAGVVRGAAPAAATLLAAVRSAPIGDQVAQMLQSSDNYLAEALARSTAAAMGKPASFGGGTEAVREAAARLGLDTKGMVLTDACGLSGGNRISATQLAELLRLAATSESAAVRTLVQGLPVAGLSGTMSARLTTGPGTGVVRAKTGTLNAVTSLTGLVVTADGRLLTFSFVYNELRDATGRARDAADRAAAALAACGCA